MKGGATAAQEWRRCVTQLAKLGHVSSLNRQSLVNYCEAFALAALALEQIHDEGITLTSGESGNQYLHPALSAWSMARATMEKEAKNLGMTPLSLQSIKSAKPAKGKPTDGKKTPKPSDFLTGGG